MNCSLSYKPFNGQPDKLLLQQGASPGVMTYCQVRLCCHLSLLCASDRATVTFKIDITSTLQLFIAQSDLYPYPEIVTLVLNETLLKYFDKNEMKFKVQALDFVYIHVGQTRQCKAVALGSSMRRSLQPTQVAQVVQLIQDGTSMRAVARRFAVSVSVVSRAWRRYTRRQASTSGDVEEAVGGQQPSSRTATSAFVQGGTGGALPESPAK
ncbi:hypothetical protein L3Q82_019854 [Scortum barcoo]|uniref:Uncharacterized protein n=1 Tax=Scortum barcoo TaxID=214431 RepID=A0ACB8VCX6_9TELE|nr:hypothetical protein L3Q82_019854 [Scortum barcoo]